MSYLSRLAWVFLGLWLLGLAPAFGQEEKPPEKPWTGKLADGRVITRADLDHILNDHNLWLASNGIEGKKADLGGANLIRATLIGANLSKANLSGARLYEANLSRAHLSWANLSKAELFYSNLSEAKLTWANLSGAKLSWANLSGADLWQADLSGAVLSKANLSRAFLSAYLSGANLFGANLTGAMFEPQPGSLPSASNLLYLKGLDTLKFRGMASYGLMELRENFKKAGMRDEERQVTYALNHNRRVNAWAEIEEKRREGKINWTTREIALLENRFQLVMFEWTCDYGMTPSRPLLILLVGLFAFTLPYLLVFRSRGRKTGLYLVLPKDESSKKQIFRLTNRTPFRPLPSGIWGKFKMKVSRGFRLVRLAFYFSLLSAFNLGWRELNVGNWISRLQKREYALQAKGWVRTVAGFQSLLSVYLLALWALTYFGRPFE
jgi:hypothetical protein